MQNFDELQKCRKLRCLPEWQVQNPITKTWKTVEDSPAGELPALLGPSGKRLTIWLPSGARVVCRAGPSGFSFPCWCFHYLADQRIAFLILELQPGECWPLKPSRDF